MSIADSRLIQLFRTFSQKEWKAYGKFVLQNLGDKSADYQLWRYLNRSFPKFRSADMDRSKALKSVFGPKEKDDRKLRRLMNRMNEDAQTFLTITEINSEPIQQGLHVLRQFGKRGLEKHHESLSKRLSKQLEDLPKNLEWHSLDYQLEEEQQHFSEKKYGRKEENRVQEVSEKLDIHFMTNKLKQACAAYTRQRLFNQEFDLGLLPFVLNYLEENPPKESLLRLYHRCTLMIKQEEDQLHYAEFKKLLRDEQYMVSFRELQDLHVLAQNHCIRAINTGKQAFIQELFDLYKLGLEQEVIQSDPTHFAPAFKNIVSVAMKLEEYAWAENFINQNAEKLGPRYEQDYLRYNLAALNFAQGRFLECRKFIHVETFSDAFIKLNVRILLLKTYFELNQLDLLESQLESFKQFLHRNKKLSYHRKNCENLISFLKKLLALGPDDQIKADRLTIKISESKNLAESAWLLDKLAERKK